MRQASKRIPEKATNAPIGGSPPPPYVKFKIDGWKSTVGFPGLIRDGGLF